MTMQQIDDTQANDLAGTLWCWGDPLHDRADRDWQVFDVALCLGVSAHDSTCVDVYVCYDSGPAKIHTLHRSHLYMQFTQVGR